tara:strand:+ start:1067 stop:1531 length:465 start_codon:yes stop_codon:yes gene_type:complete
MSGYIGPIPVPQGTQTRQSFTATASQTSFATAGYTAGFLDVYLNGVKLVEASDYTATNGTDIVLTQAASADDTLEVTIFTGVDTTTASGGGRYKGERGTVGTSTQAGDIFRVHEKQLDTDVTIAATENAIAGGPLTIASGVTLTITSGGDLSIV